MRFSTLLPFGASNVKAIQVKKNSPRRDLRAPPVPPDPKTVLDVALRMLGRRALSVMELCDKLEARGFDEDARASAQARLEDFGYLNDQTLAVNIIQQARRSGRGPLWVRRTLHRRRISPTVLQRNDVDCDPAPDSSHQEVAARLVRRRFTDLQDIKVKQRAMRFLCNRGFAPPVALGIITQVAAQESGDP